MKTNTTGEFYKQTFYLSVAGCLGFMIALLVIYISYTLLTIGNWDCVVVKLGGLDKPNECVMYKRKDFKLYGIPSDRHGDDNQQQG